MGFRGLIASWQAGSQTGKKTRSSNYSPLFVAAASLFVVALLAGCGRQERATRSTSALADGITSVRIVSEAGDLEVVGQTGLTEIAATGRAFASSVARLDDVQFVVTTNGSEMVIEARTPGNASFDVVITLPDSLDVVIEDGSGDILVRDVADVSIDDGSGDILVHDVADLSINDGSGDIIVRDVEGVSINDDSGDVSIRDVVSVLVNDDAGDIDIEGVSAGVVIEDSGSGDLRIVGVLGSVEIAQDGSGDIDIADVGGDVYIGEDGAADINISDVTGHVVIAGKSVV